MFRAKYYVCLHSTKTLFLVYVSWFWSCSRLRLSIPVLALFLLFAVHLTICLFLTTLLIHNLDLSVLLLTKSVICICIRLRLFVVTECDSDRLHRNCIVKCYHNIIASMVVFLRYIKIKNNAIIATATLWHKWAKVLFVTEVLQIIQN